MLELYLDIRFVNKFGYRFNRHPKIRSLKWISQNGNAEKNANVDILSVLDSSTIYYFRENYTIIIKHRIYS